MFENRKHFILFLPSIPSFHSSLFFYHFLIQFIKKCNFFVFFFVNIIILNVLESFFIIFSFENLFFL